MKTVLKLIFIGIIAGIAWKYLDDRNINVVSSMRDIAGRIEKEINSLDWPSTITNNQETQTAEQPVSVPQTSYESFSGHRMVTQEVAGPEEGSSQPSVKWDEPSGSAIEWVKDATRRYSPDSWQLLMNYDELPMSSEAMLKDGSTTSSSKPAGTFSYLEGSDRSELLSSMSTNVHEISHGYFHYNTYTYARENNISLDWECADGFIYISPGKSVFVSFPSKYLFPSKELKQVIPSPLVTFRYETYIDGNTSTQQAGVIGLLNELHAYFLGSRCTYDMLEAYKSAEGSENAGLIEWIKNISSEMTAFYEFDYFIKEYLLRMKNNYPENYDQLKACRNFCEAYSEVRAHYDDLISRYRKRVDSELERINSASGFEAQMDGGQLWILDKSTGRSQGVHLFDDDREKLLPVLESDRYNKIIADFLN